MMTMDNKRQCLKEKEIKGDAKNFDPYGKCTISSMLFDLNIRFLPIEKSMFSGLTKLPKNIPSTKEDGRYPTKHLLKKLIEYKNLKKKTAEKENKMPLKTFLESSFDLNDVTLMSTYIPPTVLTTATQTDYRDEEVQTDPYSPNYYIPSNSDPNNNEIVSISMLNYGCGLPAGNAEVEIIARLKKKKLWDIEQKNLSEKCQMEKRLKNIEEAYAQEWFLRDEEIQRILDLRLSVTMKMLQMREEQNDDYIKMRIEKLWNHKLQEMDEKLDVVKRMNLRAIRKIMKMKCQNLDMRVKRDIVKDYTDHGSQVFAPLTRLGVFHDKNASKMEVQSCYLNTYEGILDLEKRILKKGCNVFNASKFKQKETFENKRRRRKEAELEKILQTLKKERTTNEKGPVQLKFLQKIEKPAMRPPTPSLTFDSQESIDEELAIGLLQKTLRGRQEQKMMLGGKQMSSELIKELRSTHALLKNEQDIIAAQKEFTLTAQKKKSYFEDKEMKIDSLLADLEGDALSDAIDFLTKELDRLKEEKKVDAFVMLAERNRRMREAEESGMRQIEERRRRGADEVFKQIVKVHQDTVDDYLQSIIMETVRRNAEEEATNKIKQIAKDVDDAAHATELSRSTIDTEEIVARLVLNFLIPEVNKQTHKQKEEKKERKYLESAHNSLKE